MARTVISTTRTVAGARYSVVADFLLMETNDFLLQEDNTSRIVLETNAAGRSTASSRTVI